jgi:outer membrane protein OmpA-like peptidoglycan-associated protein
MKNWELLNLYQVLSSVSDLKGVKFSYFVVKNLGLIEREIKNLEVVIKASKDYYEFEEKRIELAKKHAKKDKKGEPKTKEVNGKKVFDMKSQVAFDKEFKKLQKEYKETLEERQEQIKEYNELIEQDTDIKLHKIKLKDIPEEISVAQMKAIEFLIEK